MRLQPRAKRADRGLIRHRRTPHAGEGAHGPKVLQLILHARIGEVEPLLQEVDAPQGLQGMGGRPRVPLGSYGGITAALAAYGTTGFMMSRNRCVRVFFLREK